MAGLGLRRTHDVLHIPSFSRVILLNRSLRAARLDGAGLFGRDGPNLTRRQRRFFFGIVPRGSSFGSNGRQNTVSALADHGFLGKIEGIHPLGLGRIDSLLLSETSCTSGSSHLDAITT